MADPALVLLTASVSAPLMRIIAVSKPGGRIAQGSRIQHDGDIGVHNRQRLIGTNNRVVPDLIERREGVGICLLIQQSGHGEITIHDIIRVAPAGNGCRGHFIVIKKRRVTATPGRTSPTQLVASDQLVLTEVGASVPAQKTGAAEAKRASRLRARTVASGKARRNQER